MRDPRDIADTIAAPAPLSAAEIADAEDRYMILDHEGGAALLEALTDEYVMNLEPAVRANLERQLNVAAAWHTMRYRCDLAEQFTNKAAKLAAMRLGEN